MTTGQQIKAARIKAGLTQKELGAKLGVSESFIAQYETDKRNPKKETIARIADALGAHYLDLYGDEERIEIASFVRMGMKLSDKIQEDIQKGENYDISVEYVRYLQQNGYKFTEDERQLVSLYNQLNDFTQQIVITDLARLCLSPKHRKDGKGLEQRPAAPQDTPAPQEGTDTTPPPEDAEGPQEGQE